MLELNQLTWHLIGAGIEVHRALGPGFVETVYAKALRLELWRKGIAFRSEVEVDVFYLDEKVGTHRLDLLIEDQVVVELKAVPALLPVHYLVLRSYLRAVDRRHGLLLNFAKVTLEKRRVSDR